MILDRQSGPKLASFPRSDFFSGACTLSLGQRSKRAERTVGECAKRSLRSALCARSLQPTGGRRGKVVRAKIASPGAAERHRGRLPPTFHPGKTPWDRPQPAPERPERATNGLGIALAANARGARRLRPDRVQSLFELTNSKPTKLAL